MKVYALIECWPDGTGNDPTLCVKGYRSEAEARKAAIDTLKLKFPAEPVFETIGDMLASGESYGIVKDLLAHCIDRGVMWDFKLVLDWVRLRDKPAKRAKHKETK